MRVPNLNTMILALIFSLLTEATGIRVYGWLSTSFNPGTFASRLCDLYLFIHKPAVKLTQMFYPANQWPGVGAHILYYIFALCECWILTIAVIWICGIVTEDQMTRIRQPNTVLESTASGSLAQVFARFRVCRFLRRGSVFDR